jgi:hypothetical protein
MGNHDVAYSNNQAAKPAAPAMGRPVIMGAPLVDVGAPPDVAEPAALVTLARVDEAPEARLLASEAMEELASEASEARELVTESTALEAELAALDASLARLDVTPDASLARLDVTLDASLARLDVMLLAPPEAEAKADDRTPRAPVEMAVAEALADWAMAREGQRDTSMDGGPTYKHSRRCRTR